MGECCRYQKISIPPSDFEREFPRLLEEFDGLNVTMPYKQSVLAYLQETQNPAKRLKAVNTVICRTKVGYNTDYDGFSYMLQDEGISVEGLRALVLGAGGAGRSCVEKLKELKAQVSLYGKYPAQLKEIARDLGGFTPVECFHGETYDLVVNCTGIGMGDTVDEIPLVRIQSGERAFSSKGSKFAIDLIYEPKLSAFLREAKEAGAKTLNGEKMLFFQAYLSDCIFLDRPPKFGEAKKFYSEYQTL